MFVYLKCDKCNKHTILPKPESNEIKCYHCGNTFSNHIFKKCVLKKVYHYCECGIHSVYLTNEDNKMIEIPCRFCKYPVTLMLNEKINKYITIS